MRAPQPTAQANRQYDVLRDRLAHVRLALERAEQAHGLRQARDPGNWGYAGDVGAALALVEQAVAALDPRTAREAGIEVSE